MKHTPIPYERQEIIRRERDLAKYANTMDSLFCIPFTKQGIGVDAILSLIPLVGDIAGLFLTMKAFRMGRELGVPEHKMRPAIYLAFADMVLGMIPVVGTLIDIFLQPSRRTLKVINEHVRSEYGIDYDMRPLQNSFSPNSRNPNTGFRLFPPLIAPDFTQIPP